MTLHPISGVYAASITPLHKDLSIALDDIPVYLAYLAKRGCHGALLLGTTGEGPSFSADERLKIFESGCRVWQEFPNFRLLAGTGTPSLEETIFLTKSAFDLGYTGAVVLPPYYFHQATEDGLFFWFQDLISRAVPGDGYLLGYHFPAQSGVPIPLKVLTRLRDAFPAQFIGLKDSSSDAEYSIQIGKDLDKDFIALVGNDKLFSEALNQGASGCITAMANLHSPTLRKIWDAHQAGETAHDLQEFINTRRNIMDGYRPFPATIKVLLSEHMGFPAWTVRYPLTPLPDGKIPKLIQDMRLETEPA